MPGEKLGSKGFIGKDDYFDKDDDVRLANRIEQVEYLLRIKGDDPTFTPEEEALLKRLDDDIEAGRAVLMGTTIVYVNSADKDGALQARLYNNTFEACIIDKDSHLYTRVLAGTANIFDGVEFGYPSCLGGAVSMGDNNTIANAKIGCYADLGSNNVANGITVGIGAVLRSNNVIFDAVFGPRVHIGNNNEISACTEIGKFATLGSSNRVVGSTIKARVTVGNGNGVFRSTVGKGANIGNRNTLLGGCSVGERHTVVGDGNLFRENCAIATGAEVGNNTELGGDVNIPFGAYVESNSTIDENTQGVLEGRPRVILPRRGSC